MEFFYSVFDVSLPRLGPGNEESAKKVLDIILSAGIMTGKPKLKILDIGCGLGNQTIQVAKTINSEIIAVDNHQPYLDELKHRAEAAGVSDRITVRLKDMHKMELPESSFDLIWSEGALYLMGVREGMQECHKLLKPGGFAAVSDMVWLKPDPPKECWDYLAPECPFLTDIQGNLNIMKETGFRVIEYFILPESAWMDTYYIPLEKRLNLLHEKYLNDKEKLKMIEYIQKEIVLYRKYSSYYGYIFFVMQRD